MDQEKSELLPIVMPDGATIGCAERSRCHGGEKLLHPVVHLHVARDGRLLLQHRSKFKKIQPDKWDTAVGGHVSYGEDIEVALKRETAEEIGLTVFEPVKITSYIFESQVEKELVNTFFTEVADGFEPSCEESDIDRFGFFSLDEIERMNREGLTTPNFCQEFQSILLPFLKKD